MRGDSRTALVDTSELRTAMAAAQPRPLPVVSRGKSLCTSSSSFMFLALFLLNMRIFMTRNNWFLWRMNICLWTQEKKAVHRTIKSSDLGVLCSRKFTLLDKILGMIFSRVQVQCYIVSTGDIIVIIK